MLLCGDDHHEIFFFSEGGIEEMDGGTTKAASTRALFIQKKLCEESSLTSEEKKCAVCSKCHCLPLLFGGLGTPIHIIIGLFKDNLARRKSQRMGGVVGESHICQQLLVF
jgi:hypothetical protein